MAHLLGHELYKKWDQSFTVDNRGGAGGAIGTEMAARAAPDGYTLIIATASTLVINPLVTKSPSIRCVISRRSCTRRSSR